MPCTVTGSVAAQVHMMREKLAAAAAEASRLQRLRTEQAAHQQAAILQVRGGGTHAAPDFAAFELAQDSAARNGQSCM